MDPGDQKEKLHVRTTADLEAAGYGRTRRDALVRESAMLQLGRSWYGTWETPPDVAAALRCGARLTCLSALKHYGVWVPIIRGRHEVALRGGGGGGGGARTSRQPPGDARLGRNEQQHRYLRTWPDSGPLLPLRHALLDVVRCQDVETLAIVLESVAVQGLLPWDEVCDIVASLPVRVRRGLGIITATSQSGTETRVRRHLESRRVRVVAQANLLPDEHMDLQVGEVLVIECDSRTHHADPKAYANDRRRDQQLMLRGYRVLRLTWEDVMLRWDETRLLLDAILAQELHRAPRGHRGGNRGSLLLP